MRIIDWTKWKHKIPINAFLLYFRVSGIHPAADKRPLSASLVGRSSHVKLSVRSIARSILRCWSLRQRKLTVIFEPLNVGMQEKDSRNILSRVVRFFSNENLRNKDSLGVKSFYYSNGQKTLSHITIPGIWTIHMFYTESWLSQYLSQCETINLRLITVSSLSYIP
jgi:hypothetical protein